MIGISFLIGIGVWITLAVMISRRIPRWLGIAKRTTLLSVAVFPLVLIAPVADDVIGRWQFYRLCDREAVVTLSPDWEKVKRARNIESTRDLGGYMIPIRVQSFALMDLDVNESFFSFKAFHTKGGFLMRHGLGLGTTTSCWPPDWSQVMSQINSGNLIKQGRSR